tara:strand:+ start:150 stop:1118 length:969 start_codon:yes stop_codon:yes gene_type:complete
MKNILLYNSGGGLGDSIQLMPLIISLQNHFKNSNFYYLGAHKNHFLDKLKEYKINIKTLDLKLEYFGFRWWHYLKTKKEFKKNNIKEFDLIIDLQSKLRNTIILKKIPHKIFYSSTFNFKFCTKKKSYISNKNLVDMTLDNLDLCINTKIKKLEYNIENLPKEFIRTAKKLLPNNNYIGFSLTQGNAYRKKTWPINKFIELSKKIKIRQKVPVFFIERNEIDLINKIKSEVSDALFPELNLEKSCPALVTALAQRLEKAISIDNGVMHMMSLAKIPMVILFGPTNPKKFAPNNNNIKIIDSNVNYNTDDLSKITVEEVLNNI